MVYNSKMGAHAGKLKLRYIGPYKIISDLGQGTFRLQDYFGTDVPKPVNGFRLKLFVGKAPMADYGMDGIGKVKQDRMGEKADMPTASEFQKRGLDVDTNYVDLIPPIMIVTRVVFSSSRPFESSGHLLNRTPRSLQKTSHVMHPLYSFTMQTNGQLVRLNELRAQLAAVKMVGTRGSEAQQQLGTPRQAKSLRRSHVSSSLLIRREMKRRMWRLLATQTPIWSCWTQIQSSGCGILASGNLLTFHGRCGRLQNTQRHIYGLCRSEVGLWHPKCR